MAKGKYLEWLEPDGLLLLEGWARDGLTDAQIAINVGVSERTFTDWKSRFSAISSALKKGKAPIDIQVENALLKRALGFEYEEITTEVSFEPYTDKKGKTCTREVKHVKKTKKYVPPDVTAQIFWLKNRKPESWRDRRDETVTFGDADPEIIEELERMVNDMSAGK